MDNPNDEVGQDHDRLDEAEESWRGRWERAADMQALVKALKQLASGLDENGEPFCGRTEHYEYLVDRLDIMVERYG